VVRKGFEGFNEISKEWREMSETRVESVDGL
jgi:hypothetical protein